MAMGPLAGVRVVELAGIGPGPVAAMLLADMSAERGTNLLDSGAPFYDVYECADGKYVTIGPIETKFYRELLQRLELDAPELAQQMDTRNWPATRTHFAAKFRTRSQAEWTRLLEGTDVCFAPVLDLEEAYQHPHLQARQTFIDVAGVMQPAPAPRFSRTPSARPQPPAALSTANASAALSGWLPDPEIAALRAAGTFI
jgi:crotonobetainyl-CoA:carnitine CoA-transferase CaiB-like acyl-CoA transferase